MDISDTLASDGSTFFQKSASAKSMCLSEEDDANVAENGGECEARERDKSEPLLNVEPP